MNDFFFNYYNQVIMGNNITANEKDLLTSHPQFKFAKLIHHKDHHAIKSLIPCDEETYNQWKTTFIRDIKKLQNSDFLLIPNKHTFNREKFCGKSGHVDIQYDSYPYLLSEEITRRKEKQQPFIEGDLWFLLYALTGAKQEIEEVCGHVGDIRPQNVFINQEGQVKVGCMYSFPNQRSNFDKFLQKQPTYLAPEDLHLLKQGTPSNEINKKSQLFSIGMTVLSAGILQNPSLIYDNNNLTLNIEKLQMFLKRWIESYQYSEIFRAIILNLVQLNADDRLSVQELWKWIVKYEASIKNKEKFVIRTEHEIIQKEVARIRGHVRI